MLNYIEWIRSLLIALHKFGVLTFLQRTDVIRGFANLSLNIIDNYQDVADYFDEIYRQTFSLRNTSVKN